MNRSGLQCSAISDSELPREHITHSRKSSLPGERTPFDRERARAMSIWSRRQTMLTLPCHLCPLPDHIRDSDNDSFDEAHEADTPPASPYEHLRSPSAKSPKRSFASPLKLDFSTLPQFRLDKAALSSGPMTDAQQALDPSALPPCAQPDTGSFSPYPSPRHLRRPEMRSRWSSESYSLTPTSASALPITPSAFDWSTLSMPAVHTRTQSAGLGLLTPPPDEESCEHGSQADWQMAQDSSDEDLMACHESETEEDPCDSIPAFAHGNTARRTRPSHFREFTIGRQRTSAMAVDSPGLSPVPPQIVPRPTRYASSPLARMDDSAPARIAQDLADMSVDDRRNKVNPYFL
ncbi:uncharacterized protein L969DRAFT_622954 [Mixia osmundae IAM 14324]|uniref:uncharacterized protein n=1 Tax=Mixia osmundae (strain CBS 9802 / IAM 14324 / JCM 22182 / KY 12970) TaxID=764103 RepID=UPI0004A55040|nr:uncharacterized protein L969DRAFT_622954 [Mixia osmundae IAM 14324]KEI39614.1 hypothetical protein L969DRAFT_622954 [Mixia osmundae IAM 14324]